MVRTWSIQYKIMTFLIKNNIPIYANNNKYYINFYKVLQLLIKHLKIKLNIKICKIIL